jgi:hypothetical protein
MRRCCLDFHVTVVRRSRLKLRRARPEVVSCNTNPLAPSVEEVSDVARDLRADILLGDRLLV